MTENNQYVDLILLKPSIYIHNSTCGHAHTLTTTNRETATHTHK